MKILERIWKGCLDLLYPKTCYFCGKLCYQQICGECKEKVVYIKEPRCKKCGKPVRYEEQEYCGDCQKHKFHYEQGRSLWIHKGAVPWSIYQFKYHNRRIYGEFYAQELYRLYGEWIQSWKIDLIIPVPLHRNRRRKRGYNQAEIVAKHLGKLMNIPVDTKAVIRNKYTKPQKILDNKERRKNLKDAFEVRKPELKFRNILLIDDIYTTGSTIDEIAKILMRKRHNKIWFLTISIGQDF